MIELPDTNGLSVSRAAVAYVRADIPVVPFDPHRGKVCGNLLGNPADDSDKWYQHVSTNGALIGSWRQRFGSFNRLALATSPGAFGAIVLDVDRPHEVSPDWWPLLEVAPFTATRPTEQPRRGHYWFMLPPGHPLVGNPRFNGGDIRTYGGGLVLAPFPNDDRHVVRPGVIPEIPAELLALIADSGCVGVGQAITLEAFCTKHQGNRYPNKLKGQIRIHDQKRAAGMSPHDAMVYVLRLGLGEAALGFVPASAVLDTFRARWERSPREFQNIARWCAATVEGASPQALEELEAMSRRSAGSDSRQYAGKLK